jgi:hypothetical protein
MFVLEVSAEMTGYGGFYHFWPDLVLIMSS